jgi:hypothetical protein
MAAAVNQYIENTVRTVVGSYIQTNLLLNRPFDAPDNTTLNQKFDIYHGEVLPANPRPEVKYITIGNRGHQNIIGAEGIAYNSPIPHTPEHTALYNHIPFVLRPISQDLTALERQKYRLRRLEVHNGDKYYAYYAKLLDFTNTQTKMELKTVVENNITTSPYYPSLENLSPTPPTILPNQVLTVTGDYIITNARVELKLSPLDIEELLNVGLVLYGNEQLAIISELGVLSGVDKTIVIDQSASPTGAALSYTEVLAAQVVSFISTYAGASQNRDGITVGINVGHTEPLLKLSA